MEKIGKKINGVLRVATGSMILMTILGFIFAIADISAALNNSAAKLFPFGWIRVLRAIRKKDE